MGTNRRPISAIVNGDINGDESTRNDLAFVFDSHDPSTPAAIAGAMRRVLNNANLVNPAWGAEYQLPVGISNQNPVVQRLPLLKWLASID